MSSDARDDGLTADQLGGSGWVLGLLGVGCFVRLLVLVTRPEGDPTEMLVWAVATVVLVVMAATCAVVAGVKRAEVRLRIELQYLTRHLGTNG